MALIVVLCEGILRLSRFGWNFQAISREPEAAIRASMPVAFYYSAVFAFSSCMCVLAAICELRQTSSFSTDLGRGVELDAIVAVLIGKFFSPKFRISFLGSAIGAYLLTGGVDYADFLGVTYRSQYLVKGLVIAIASAIFARNRRSLATENSLHV